MHALSLFIHVPLSPAIEDALVAIKEKVLFALHILPIDQDVLPVVLESCPCVCLFSVFDESSRVRVSAIIAQLRILMMEAELKNNVAPPMRLLVLVDGLKPIAVVCQQVGVHEVLQTPILPKVLAFKLTHQGRRAIAISNRKVPAFNVKLVPSPSEGSRWSYSFPEGSEANSRGPVCVMAQHPLLAVNRGNWVIDSENLNARGAWRWSDRKDETNRWRFSGEKPEYDKATRSWSFEGNRPTLIQERKDGQPEKIVHFDEQTDALQIESSTGISIQAATLSTAPFPVDPLEEPVPEFAQTESGRPC